MIDLIESSMVNAAVNKVDKVQQENVCGIYFINIFIYILNSLKSVDGIGILPTNLFKKYVRTGEKMTKEVSILGKKYIFPT